MKKLIALTLALVMLFAFAGCGEKAPAETPAPTATPAKIPADAKEALEGIDLVYAETVELEYAKNFAIFNLEDDFSLLATYDDTLSLYERILVVPQGKEAPANLPDGVYTVSKGSENIMLSSAPMMSLTNALGKVDSVKLSTTTTWYIDEVNEALDAGKIVDVGKYTAPDYELIVANMPEIAMFSTMISSKPEVFEQLTALGLEFFNDQSTNEATPLGRTEWLKFLGVIYDEYDLACELFDKQVKIVKDAEAKLEGVSDADKKSVLFLYVTSKGNINLRHQDDYLSNAIAAAGGNGIFTTEGQAGSSSITVTPELFYTLAVDADVIIYNYSLGGKPKCAQDIIDSRDLEILKDFKAYQTGDIWATSQDFYQVTDTIGQMIGDINTAIYDENAGDELTYLNRLK